MMFRSLWSSILVAGSFAMMAQLATSAEPPAPSDIWKIELGKSYSEIPSSFAEFACGTNGGPPGAPLDGFGDFMQCEPEPTGWREVYFRFDDELEYWAKANDVPELVVSGGTKVYNFPVIVSVLIDESGLVKGLRMVSDPRDATVPRANARFLLPFLISRFRPDNHDWDCTDLPPATGESPVAGEFLKKDCTVEADGHAYSVSARYLRGVGERQFDPTTGKLTEGQFESHVRFEMHEL